MDDSERLKIAIEGLEEIKGILGASQERAIREALRLNKDSVNGAAQSLGIHRSTLYRLMRKYGIEIRRIVA